MFAKLARAVQIVIACASTVACGTSTAPVLERIEPSAPPEFTERVEVFLVNRVGACAIGRACASADTSNCFFVRSASATTSFDPGGVEFVAPDDPRVTNAARSACFQLGLEQASQDSAAQSFSQLRNDIYRLSAGRIDLDLRLHAVTPDRGDFKLWEGGSGIFLQPSSLEIVGLPLMSRDSDFVFAISGENDDGTQGLPKIEPCGGTNWQAQGGLGGAAYTWLSQSCVSSSQLRWHWLYQAYFGLRDVVGFEDLYGNGYPSCGQGAADPKRWFPRPSDCALDPDAASCGQARCDETTFDAHVLMTHWPSEPGVIGNHCRNGRTDYDESAPDRGGVCDQLGR